MIVAFGAAVQLLWAAFQPTISVVRDNITAAVSGEKSRSMKMWELMDHLILGAMPPQHEGNVLVQLPGLAPGDAHDDVLATPLYYRGVYILWPRRMFIASTETIVNTSADL